MAKKQLTKRDETVLQYQMKILGALQDGLFEEDSSNFIDTQELHEGDNATHFLHALANTVPSSFYQQFTGEKTNNLDFNHIANKLCFQYARPEKND